ncbi:SigB/SigF/SigG family RNA polymerase sigma factor [Streptomyces sp. NPDC017993]|uniref:SigB/SigF/SigG family RNA polymerase sigma factor n=1 Tax=Streptomyces sp. NPDC017993 TaxID=3365027 RepID=UPI0037B503DE
MSSSSTARGTGRESLPDTAAAFAELADLPQEAPRRREVREDIVCAWLPLAHRLAGPYSGRGAGDEDLRQVAALGLLKAVDRYDPRTGCPFPGYAIPTIRGEIKRYFRNDLWALHVPRRTHELRTEVHRARKDLEIRPGAAVPSVRDLSEHTGLTENEVLLGMEAQESLSTLSLERPLSTEADRPRTLADTLGADDPALRLVEERITATPALHRLPRRERTILYLRYFRDLTQREIAAEMGISQMHVSRLLERSCARVRARVLVDGCGPAERGGTWARRRAVSTRRRGARA